MHVARVRHGIVINVEVVDDDSPQARELTSSRLELCSLGHEHAEVEQLVPYTDDNPAHIGYGYDPENGLEQPPPPPPPLQEATDE